LLGSLAEAEILDTSETLTALDRNLPLTERVAERLREAIVSGEIAPGTRLSVPEIARRLNVSRTPAREGLLMLEREGLVVPHPTSGVTVLVGDTQDVLDLFDLREGLEAIAARRAAERLPGVAAALDAIVDRHEDAVARKDLAGHIECDREFHRTIREATGNLRLSRQLLQIEQQLVVLNRMLSDRPGWRGTTVTRDHRRIAKAIGSGDPDAAESAIRRHIGRSRAFYSGDRG
jgi:DNA-binding GntR family transcriptional regulator